MSSGLQLLCVVQMSPCSLKCDTTDQIQIFYILALQYIHGIHTATMEGIKEAFSFQLENVHLSVPTVKLYISKSKSAQM